MTAAELERVVREEWGRLVALLLARYRRLDLVEDALGDAVEAAARTWPAGGVPDNPAGWLHRAAGRRMVDQLRAEAMRQRRAPLLVTEAERGAETGGVMADPGDLLEDDLLRLVLMCTHPALRPEAAAALALRLVLGVTTHDVARLFLVPEPTMAARLTRARKTIVAAGIPFAVPAASELPERIDTVARTAYLAFTAGYAPGSGTDLLRADLAGEAVRLARVVRALSPDEPVLTALLALVLLQHSRRDARVGERGELVLLADQDRALWRRDEIDEGLALIGELAGPTPMTPAAAGYLLQARIAAEHATSATPDDVDWRRIVSHYDLLLRVAPSPAAELARTVAVAEADGPGTGLAALDAVRMPGSHRPAAVRADLLARLGRTGEARAAYAEAIGLCRNEGELAHLRERLDRLDPA
ncbi:RNA polymerase sigma factor [Georgenia sp. Z1491]|uniref:RNA polymerase sigma factor n=1 Tax=Georgenia sp. Z1491 TaxID=3416707 RepID=UPI003CE79DC2